MIKNNKNMSIADLLVSNRKTNMEFFEQIQKLIDFKEMEKVINKLYQFKNDAVRNSSWSGLLLFKINLLGIWYGLSDKQLEISVNDRISFSQFIRLPLDLSCPDHSTIWRFRERMKDAGAWDKLLDTINEQLIRHKVIVKTGVNADASIRQKRNPFNYNQRNNPFLIFKFSNYQIIKLFFWASTSPLVPSSVPLSPFFLPKLHRLIQISLLAGKNGIYRAQSIQVQFFVFSSLPSIAPRTNRHLLIICAIPKVIY